MMMMMKIHGVSIVLLSLFCVFAIGNCMSVEPAKSPVGAVSNSANNGIPNDGGDVTAIARYAIDEHNRRENARLEFVRVVQSREQVVSGKLYHIVVDANDGGKTNRYAVKVLVKPWMNFKQLQAFAQAPPGNA